MCAYGARGGGALQCEAAACSLDRSVDLRSSNEDIFFPNRISLYRDTGAFFDYSTLFSQVNGPLRLARGSF